MDNHVLKQNVVGIALLYVIITSIFAFLNKLITYVVFASQDYVQSVIMYNGIWAAFIIVAIILLAKYLKKINDHKFVSLINNDMVRMITGAVVAIQGGIELSITLPLNILSIQSLLSMEQTIDIEVKRQVITSQILAIVVIISQIMLGIYLMKYYNKNHQGQDIKGQDIKDRDIKGRGIKDHDIKDHDIKDRDIWDRDIWDRDIKNRDIKDRDIKNHEIKDHNIVDSNIIDHDIVDHNIVDYDIVDYDIIDYDYDIEDNDTNLK